MTRVYQLTNREETPNFQLASRAYVDAAIKKLSDAIAEQIYSKFDLNDMAEVEELKLNDETPVKPKAEDIDTDSKHQFVSAAQIAIFKDKVSSFELQSAIDNLNNELKGVINDSFVKLLNNENALQRLKDINYLIDESRLETLISLLSEKATKEELEEHVKSIYHLDNNDRKALNLLLDFIKTGCADWDAGPDAPNYIRNKPESLPANGGNADTVCGYGIQSLKNHQAYDIIFGIGNDKTNAKVDILLPPDGSKNNDIAEYLSKRLSDATFSYSLFFRTGCYKFEIINFKKHSINGSPSRDTIFMINSMNLNSTTIRDITFENSNIHIGSRVFISDCIFNNCNVYIDASDMSTIKSCNFAGCNIVFSGICTNNIIMENRFMNSGNPAYYGGNNLIGNNLIY